MPRKFSFLGMVEFFEMLGWVPAWCWILTAGSTGIVALTLFVARSLPPTSRAAAWWGDAQFLLGVLAVVVAQTWALFRHAEKDDRVGPFDLLFLSVRVWRIVIRRLPQTSGTLCAGGWGLTLAAGSLAAFGLPFVDLTDMQPAKKRADRPVQPQLRKANDNLKREQYRVLTERAARDVAAQPTTAPATPVDNPSADTRPTTQCVVIGYVPAEDGRPIRLLLATERNGRLTYAGSVSRGLGTEDVNRLTAAERRDAPAEPQVNAVWIKPTFCQVQASGVDDRGQLQDPSFRGLLNE
jgi:hypothetical protein